MARAGATQDELEAFLQLEGEGGILVRWNDRLDVLGRWLDVRYPQSADMTEIGVGDLPRANGIRRAFRNYVEHIQGRAARVVREALFRLGQGQALDEAEGAGDAVGEDDAADAGDARGEDAAAREEAGAGGDDGGEQRQPPSRLALIGVGLLYFIDSQKATLWLNDF